MLEVHLTVHVGHNFKRRSRRTLSLTETSFVSNYFSPVMNDLTEMSNANPCVLEQKPMDCASTESNGLSGSFIRHRSTFVQASVHTEVFKRACEMIGRV